METDGRRSERQPGSRSWPARSRAGHQSRLGERGIRCRSGMRRIAWPLLLITCATTVLVAGIETSVGAAITTDNALVTTSERGITGWILVGSYDENTLYAGEGVATVSDPQHQSHELYRGLASIPSTLKAQGWAHIGDPDSARGNVFDAYQGPGSGHSKMFLVTDQSGTSSEYVHALVPGELYNNSFVAVSPDTQWMIAGEWNTMSHLQIYPTPLLNHNTSPHGGSLKLAGYIKLDHKVNDVQGCDFVTPVKLVCASDDDSRSLFPNEKPLVQIDLPKPLTEEASGDTSSTWDPSRRRAPARAPSRQRASTSIPPPAFCGLRSFNRAAAFSRRRSTSTNCAGDEAKGKTRVQSGSLNTRLAKGATNVEAAWRNPDGSRISRRTRPEGPMNTLCTERRESNPQPTGPRRNPACAAGRTDHEEIAKRRSRWRESDSQGPDYETGARPPEQHRHGRSTWSRTRIDRRMKPVGSPSPPAAKGPRSQG